MIDAYTCHKIEKVITKLHILMDKPFGGKLHGKYRISYERLSMISGVSIWTDEAINLLAEFAYQAELAVFRSSGGIAVFNLTAIRIARNVTQPIAEALEFDLVKDGKAT